MSVCRTESPRRRLRPCTRALRRASNSSDSCSSHAAEACSFFCPRWRVSGVLTEQRYRRRRRRRRLLHSTLSRYWPNLRHRSYPLAVLLHHPVRHQLVAELHLHLNKQILIIYLFVRSKRRKILKKYMNCSYVLVSQITDALSWHLWAAQPDICKLLCMNVL